MVRAAANVLNTTPDRRCETCVRRAGVPALLELSGFRNLKRPSPEGCSELRERREVRKETRMRVTACLLEFSLYRLSIGDAQRERTRLRRCTGDRRSSRCSLRMLVADQAERH